jgi:hypothetical protein
MLGNIRDAALPAITTLAQDPSFDINEVIRRLRGASALGGGFRAIDANGDRKATLLEIVSYNGLGADAIRPFLNTMATELQCGAGGEVLADIPGVTLAQAMANGRSSVKATLTGSLDASSTLADPDYGLHAKGTASRFGRLRDNPFFLDLDLSNATLATGIFTAPQMGGRGLEGWAIGLKAAVDPKDPTQKILRMLLLATGPTGDFSSGGGLGELSLTLGDGDETIVAGKIDLR